MNETDRKLFAARLEAAKLQFAADPDDPELALGTVEVPEGSKRVVLYMSRDHPYVASVAQIDTASLKGPPEQLSQQALRSLFAASNKALLSTVRFIPGGDGGSYAAIALFHFRQSDDDEMKLRITSCAALALQVEAALNDAPAAAVG